LDAEYNIKKCEISIPETKQELKDHNRKCKDELAALDKRLKVIMGDIAVMTMILKMSDCDAKLIQTEKLMMLRCKDQCTKKHFVTFDHDAMQKQVKQLQSPSAQDLLANTFADLFNHDDDDNDEDGVDGALLQQGPVEGGDLEGEKEKADDGEGKKKQAFNRPPVPMTKVPGNPCIDPNKGAPSAEDKRAAKCTLKKSPRCYKLQQRFLIIQAGLEDDRDELMEQIDKLKADCLETQKSLESSIETDNSLLSSSQTKLAAATEKEATAGETGRQVAKENQAYNDDLVKQMKTCSNNYIAFESELCALKKIRGDLFKKFGKPYFFQDCELSKWSPEECTKVCEEGDQKLTRSVLSHPKLGAKCLPLGAERKCNLQPCPVDCVLKEWGGWSKCSSKCGGGLKTRVRDVKVPMRYDGKPCSAVSQATPCNVAACEKDCTLAAWTKWTKCSKDCDGGTKKRVRTIKDPAEGAGSCPHQWSKRRLQYKPCARHRCKVLDKNTVLKCNNTLDVVLLLDGTPKSGKDGWKAEQTAANLLIDAFTGPGVGWSAKAHFAVVHYTGPRTWTGVSKCTGKSKKQVDMEKTCRIKIAQQFSNDYKKTKSTILGLTFQPGSKLLSLGLMTVKSMFALGRKEARTVVIVFIDGAPLSFRKTLLTSREIRKKARLIYVPVVKFSPLKDLKKWASRRWQENLVPVKSWQDLEQAATGTHIVADICPRQFPQLKNKKGF